MPDNQRAERLFLAGLAMQAIIAKGQVHGMGTYAIAKAARACADALIEELNKEPENGTQD